MAETIIFTERLKLRFIDITVWYSINHLYSLPETYKYNTLGIPTDISETKSIIEPWIAVN